MLGYGVGDITSPTSAHTQLHKAEMAQLESLVCSSQDLLKKQVRRFMEQMEELCMSDRDIETLIRDAQELSEELSLVKQSQKL